MLPPELIPKDRMTVPEFWQYVGMARAHPTVHAFDDGGINPQPGDTVKVAYPAWKVSYIINIVDNNNWGEFDSLRESWEKELVTS